MSVCCSPLTARLTDACNSGTGQDLLLLPPENPSHLGKYQKGELLKGIVVSLAEQYVFAAAQAACLEMVCREVAPANCVEIRNVFNKSVNIIIAHVLFMLFELRVLAEQYVFVAAQAACGF